MEMLSRSEARLQERTRMQAYVQARVEGESARGAALEAGYSANKAAVANRDLEPKVQKRIADLLEEHGAGNDKIAKVVGDALVAVKTTKFGQQDDHWTRIKAAEFAATVTGQIKRDTNIALGVQINLPAGMAERFASYSSTQTSEREALTCTEGTLSDVDFGR